MRRCSFHRLRSLILACLAMAVWACASEPVAPANPPAPPAPPPPGPTPPTTAQLLADAQRALEDALFLALNNVDELGDIDGFSFEEARSLYKQAHDQEPTNEIAAFGLAMTTIFVLEDNPALRAAADDWDVWLDNHDPDELWFEPVTPLLWSRATLPIDMSGTVIANAARHDRVARLFFPSASAIDGDFPPTPTEHQALIRDVVLPAVATSANLLATVDDPGFVFPITERMQGENPGEADVLELDLTEVYAIRAALGVATATSDIFLAYIMEPTPYGATGAVSALTPGSTFGTLATDGASRLASAQTVLRGAIESAEQGLDFLEAESDDQSDDIIKLDPTGGDGFTPNDIQEARNVLADVDAALIGPVDVTADFGDGDVTVTVDPSRFFLNPIQDLKALSPAYEVFAAGDGDGNTVPFFRFTALNLSEWTFPDPTVNGMAPTMASSDQLIQTFNIDDAFWEIGNPVGGAYGRVFINGLNCAADHEAGGDGCPLGAIWIWDAWLYLDQWGASLYAQTGIDTNSDGIPDMYDSEDLTGTYIAAAAGGANIDVQMDLADSDGAPFMIAASLVDKKGFTGRDARFLRIGGSQITFTLMGETWVMERQ